MLSKLLEVTGHICVASTSIFVGFAPEFSALCYFSKTEHRSTKTIIQNDASPSAKNKLDPEKK